MTSISRIGIDTAYSMAATSSYDKTVRLWSLPDGKLQRTIRLPVSDGNAGKVYATALSSDGRWPAAGGWDAYYEKTKKHNLTLINQRSGDVRRLRELGNVINHISLSCDGAWLATGLGGKAAVRIYETVSRRDCSPTPIMATPSTDSTSRPTAG
jgi:WD40 repeat protein